MSFQPNPYQTSAAPPGFAPQPSQTPMVLGICSLVMGILGLISCFCCFFLPLPPISIILGAIALFQKPDQNAKIMAIVGIALSVLTLIVYLVMVVVYGAAIFSSPEFQRALK